MKYLFFLLTLFSINASGQTIVSVVPTTGTTVGKLEKFEVDIQLSQAYSGTSSTNPYDASDIRVYATFFPPNAPGQGIEQDAFFYKQYGYGSVADPTISSCDDTATAADPTFLFLVANEAQWKVRFAPDKIGTWQYVITVKTPTTTSSSAVFTMDVTNSTNPGFVKVQRDAGFIFSENNENFIPFGLNTHSPSHNNQNNFNRYHARLNIQAIDRLAESGGNAIRLMLTPASFQFEWGDGNVCNYDNGQAAMYVLDRIIEHAHDKGIYIQFCIESQSQLYDATHDNHINNKTDGTPINNAWDTNPYRRLKNPSTSRRPLDFFTDPDCIGYYKKKLRYLLARWGYSTNIMAFEMFNELEQFAQNPRADHIDPITGRNIMEIEKT